MKPNISYTTEDNIMVKMTIKKGCDFKFEINNLVYHYKSSGVQETFNIPKGGAYQLICNNEDILMYGTFDFLISSDDVLPYGYEFNNNGHRYVYTPKGWQYGGAVHNPKTIDINGFPFHQ